MASSLALKRLFSADLINRSLRPVGSVTSSASSYFTATDDHNLYSDRRSDVLPSGRREFHRSSDVIPPFLSRNLTQFISPSHSLITPGINFNGNNDAKRILNNMHFSKGMSTMIINGGNQKPSEDEENGRKFSTVTALSDEESHKTKRSLRPLSPHLPIYQPQLSSTTSILNRISAIVLTSTILGSYFYVKVGTVAFTYPNFYEFCYYSTKIVPIALEISALALVYHVYAGIGHLVADFSGKLATSKKH